MTTITKIVAILAVCSVGSPSIGQEAYLQAGNSPACQSRERIDCFWVNVGEKDIPFGDVFDAGEGSSFLIENGYEGTHFQWFEAGRGYVFRESQLRQKFETAGFLAVLSLERHETVDWYLLSDPTGASKIAPQRVTANRAATAASISWLPEIRFWPS